MVLVITAALAPVAQPAQAALPLAGKIVALNPGHDGGNSSHPIFINRIIYAGNGLWKACDTVGTTTRAGYSEHALTWDVANRTAAILRTEGAKVVLTRGTDTGAGPCVNTRAEFANASLANAVVSLHGDGSFVTGARGFHVIYPGAASTPYALRQSSTRLALKLRAGFAHTASMPYANYVAGGTALQARSDLAGLNLTKRPAVFIEMGNMKNSTDAAIMTTPAGRQRLARGVAAGITAFLTS